MFGDKSEDEDAQVNHELDQNLTEWIDVNSAHVYRTEIRLSIENDNTISDSERKHRETLNKEADQWLQRGIAINQENVVQSAIPCYK